MVEPRRALEEYYRLDGAAGPKEQTDNRISDQDESFRAPSSED